MPLEQLLRKPTRGPARRGPSLAGLTQQTSVLPGVLDVITGLRGIRPAELAAATTANAGSCFDCRRATGRSPLPQPPFPTAANANAPGDVGRRAGARRRGRAGASMGCPAAGAEYARCLGLRVARFSQQIDGRNAEIAVCMVLQEVELAAQLLRISDSIASMLGAQRSHADTGDAAAAGRPTV